MSPIVERLAELRQHLDHLRRIRRFLRVAGEVAREDLEGRGSAT